MVTQPQQLIIPTIPAPERDKAVVIKFYPGTKHFIMLNWLAAGYGILPQEFVRRMIASAFESKVKDWGFNYEHK